MRRKTIFTLLLVFSTLLQAQTIKVACVGNSITYGSSIDDREINSYPAQLQLIHSFQSVNPNPRILIARMTPISDRHPRFESGTRDWHREIQQLYKNKKLSTWQKYRKPHYNLFQHFNNGALPQTPVTFLS